MMDYQVILDFVAPLDAFVVRHYLIAIMIQARIVLFVFSACKKKYGTIADEREPGDGDGFFKKQIVNEWTNYRK